MLEHRGRLQEMVERMEKAYDTTVVSLSGAGLGLSLSFYKDIAGTHPICKEMLIKAWGFWAVSILCVLISYRTSIRALSSAVDRIDGGNHEAASGIANKITSIMGYASGTTFILGIICFAFFAVINLK